MITAKQYTDIKIMILRFEQKERINGTEFIALFNDVFNANAKFSTCCPSENRNLINRMRHQARLFEAAHPDYSKEIQTGLGTEETARLEPVKLPTLSEETPPDTIDDEGVNKPRPNVKPFNKETRGRKRKKDL